jgi:hypothetical protein
MVGLDDFIGTLPPYLSQAVTIAIHQNIFKRHPLFKNLRNKRLLAFIGSHLKPQFNSAGTYVYQQGDEI